MPYLFGRSQFLKRPRSVIEDNPDALSTARLFDAERAASGVRGPLHGIPFLIKDVHLFHVVQFKSLVSSIFLTWLKFGRLSVQKIKCRRRQGHSVRAEIPLVQLSSLKSRCAVLIGSILSHDADVVELLPKAGVIILDHANLSEWASMRSTY